MLNDTDPAARRLVIAGCLLALLGSKLALIATHGSPTPFWDQWDAEAAHVYRPYFAGTLRFADLLSPHNEHNLFFTRLTGLGLLIVNGRWDPILQMLMNAVFYTATIGVLVTMLCRGLDLTGTLLLWAFALVLYAVPFAWENSLFGMLQFYFLILFAPLGLYLLCDSTAFSGRWWAGNAVALLGFFSLASGSLTPLAFVVLALAQLALGVRSGRKEFAGILLQVAAAAFLIWLTPTIKGHQELKAQSFLEWLDALVLLASWPVGAAGRLPYLSWLGAVLMFAPVIALAVCVWRERAPLKDPRWFYLLLAVWVGWQLLAFSYGRSRNAYYVSRYMDIYLVGILVNAACLMRLVLVDLRGRLRVMVPLAVVWFVILFAAGGFRAMNTVQREINWRRDTGAIQTEAVQRYIQTGDARGARKQAAVPHPVSDGRPPRRTAVRQIDPRHSATGAARPGGSKRAQASRPDVRADAAHSARPGDAAQWCAGRGAARIQQAARRSCRRRRMITRAAARQTAAGSRTPGTAPSARHRLLQIRTRDRSRTPCMVLPEAPTASPSRGPAAATMQAPAAFASRE